MTKPYRKSTPPKDLSKPAPKGKSTPVMMQAFQQALQRKQNQ